jgi:L-rhamnose isomerase/sugar isomerase
VDRQDLREFQSANDVLMAAQTLKRGFTTDVSPILAQARASRGAAIDPVAAYRASGYRAECAKHRPGKQSLGGGIV